nr:actin-related protein 6 [Tanacetum cinerariifolium]
MPRPPSTVVVLDNGAGYIKAGTSGERSPTLILPNCTAKPPSSKKPLLPSSLLSPSLDLTSAIIKRPFDRGHLINPDLQSTIWAHIFDHLQITPQHSSLLLTEPLFTLPALARPVDEIVFEHFGFMGMFVSDGPSLVHLYEASKRPYDIVAKSGCSLVVDVGFSFGHVVPVVKDVVCNYGVKRMDLGGKALTNYLKELVSYRSVNVMDETFLMDDVKEKLCFVSSDVARDLRIARSMDYIKEKLCFVSDDVSCDLQIARRRGNDNHFRCTYVLPDGITHTKGYVKDPEEAQKYLKLSEDGELPHPEGNDQADETEVTNKPLERNKVDLTKNVYFLYFASKD